MYKDMDMNMCKVNHSDADALLPPRKRILAGLKRQNSDVNSPVPLPSAVCFNVHRSQLNNPNLSSEEIIEAARIAAIEAAKVAEAARANAEEKAAKAAKAVAAAKSALELVGIFSEEAANKGELPKKNKMTKHIPVEALYSNRKNSTNCRMDEELARKLHRAINSSPRILKNSSSSNSKNHKHKRLKSSAFSGRTSMRNDVPFVEGNPCSATSNYDNGGVEEVDAEDPAKKTDRIVGDSNELKHDIAVQLKRDNGEEWEPSRTTVLKCGKSKTEAILSLDKFAETSDSIGRKKGKLKQKKLPLSICSLRDQTSPKEVLKPRCMSQCHKKHGGQPG